MSRRQGEVSRKGEVSRSSEVSRAGEINAERLEQVRRLRIVALQAATSLLAGQYRSIFRGRGVEFDEVREYHPGDEVRDIDWNVTARTGHAYIKRYIEERLLSVFILADMSASQRIGSGEKKSSATAWLASMLAATATSGGDRTGLVMFTDQIELFLPPSRGPQHLDRVIRELLYHETRGTGTDIGQAVRSLNRMGQQRSVVFLISDVQDDSYHRDLRLCAIKNDLVAIRITDGTEHQLPDAGLVELEDNESGRRLLIDSSSPVVRGRLETESAQRRDAFDDFCRRSRIDLLDVTAGDDYARALNVFFQKRMATSSLH